VFFRQRLPKQIFEFQNQQTSILAVVAANVLLAPLACNSLRAVTLRPVRINHAIALNSKKKIKLTKKFIFRIRYLDAEVAARRVFAVVAVEAGGAVALTVSGGGVDVARATVQTLAVGAHLAELACVAVGTRAEGGHRVRVRVGHRVAEAAVQTLALAEVHRRLTTSASKHRVAMTLKIEHKNILVSTVYFLICRKDIIG